MAGNDLIQPAAARVPMHLSVVAAQSMPVPGTAAAEWGPAGFVTSEAGRIKVVFSLSNARLENHPRPSAANRPLASPAVPPGEALDAARPEAAVEPDRPISRVSGAVASRTTAERQPPPAPVKKPSVVAHTGPADALPLAVHKPRRRGTSVAAAVAHFESAGYDLAQVRATAGPVPRLYLDSLPRDLANVRPAGARKRLFVQAILPIILRVNEEIMVARWRVERLQDRVLWDGALSSADREWLVDMADLYGAVPFDVRDLLSRMDIVPPSLALAQAAEESGWGTSRFVREGNALFGQYTYNSKAGMVPAQRDADSRHRVRSHDTLLDAVRAYVHNLNSHWAYEDFRRLRSRLRRAGAPMTGDILVGQLKQYSERRAAYVQSIRQIMRQNRLGDFDRAWLHNRQWTAVVGPASRRPPI